jgi:hypothetical protein
MRLRYTGGDGREKYTRELASEESGELEGEIVVIPGNTGVSPLRETMKPSRFGRDDRSVGGERMKL